jgi:hypothetical protein
MSDERPTQTAGYTPDSLPLIRSLASSIDMAEATSSPSR